LEIADEDLSSLRYFLNVQDIPNSINSNYKHPISHSYLDRIHLLISISVNKRLPISHIDDVIIALLVSLGIQEKHAIKTIIYALAIHAEQERLNPHIVAIGIISEHIYCTIEIIDYYATLFSMRFLILKFPWFLSLNLNEHVKHILYFFNIVAKNQANETKTQQLLLSNPYLLLYRKKELVSIFKFLKDQEIPKNIWQSLLPLVTVRLINNLEIYSTLTSTLTQIGCRTSSLVRVLSLLLQTDAKIFANSKIQSNIKTISPEIITYSGFFYDLETQGFYQNEILELVSKFPNASKKKTHSIESVRKNILSALILISGILIRCF
jgi:hypothetical protein